MSTKRHDPPGNPAPAGPQTVVPSCPIGCASPFFPSGIVLPEGPLQRCGACGQLFFQGDTAGFRRSLDSFEACQGPSPQDPGFKRLRQRARRTLTRAGAILGKPIEGLRLLDVGCSSGGFIAAAASLGAKAEGVEPMPGPAAAAKAAGLTVHQGFLEQLPLPPHSFDIVSLLEVIEHVPDPLALLAACRRVLVPGGLVVIRTGNAASWTVAFMGPRWDYFCPAIGHISFFNPCSIGLLAWRSGFDLRTIHFHSVSVFRKEDVAAPVYRLGKIAAEILNWPSRLLGKSHEMEAFLQTRQ